MMVKRHLYRKSLGLIVIALFVGTILGSAIMIEPAQAASVISLKWSVNIGPWMTEVSPLSADLFGNGQQEIVLIGGPSNWGTAGAVTVLNGTNGKTIWQVTSNKIPNIGIDGHTTFDLVDLNKDGLPEIVVYGLNGPLVLNGTNGNLIWRNTLAAGGNVYGAAVDVDGDGYPEIFVSRGVGPLNGYDALTKLDHNGNILAQAFSWHPCWGGLTVADPAGDGHFKIFQGDRSNTYSARTDPYAGGGLGIHALDANTLTQLWSDKTVLCSSQAPILADVDHDGVLDVIVADQGTDGVVVLNSTDGSVLTTGGIYRKGGTNMPAHSTPTVADLHGDGNLELVDVDGSSAPDQSPYPMIWDLYNWKLDGFLPVNCSEPPKAGNVTGGSTLDLIAVAGGIGSQGGGNSVYIYSYDSNSKTYMQRGDPVTGLNYVRAFTLVQDVDRDGYNELVLSSDSGMVYCYRTPARVSNPMVRSGLTFYSENKAGAAIYVSPAIPSQPVLRQESPVDRSVNQSLTPTLSVLVTSYQGYSLTVRFNGTDSFGIWNNIDGAFNGQSGVYSVNALSMSKTGTQYYWGVTAIDSHGNRASNIYTFTTYSNPPNQIAPILNSTNSGDLTCFNQSTSDPDGNGVTNIYNWYVNNASLANLYLPFDTRTSNNPMSSDLLFADGFENNFNMWNANGNTDWTLATSQVHSGNYSAHATNGNHYLTSNSTDTSSAGGITVSFWYRKHGISDTDSVYIQFWNGSIYKNIFQLRNPNSENTWQFYSFQTYDSEYYVSNFRIRFVASSISSTGKDIWVDDVSIIVPTRTMDYSGHNNNGTVHGASWTNAGVVGGAYTFDGGTDYISVNDNPSLGADGTWSQISIEFWIRLSAAQTGTTIIAKKVASTKYANNASYMIGFQPSGTSPSDTLFWGINNDPTQNATHSVWDNTNTLLNVGQWYFIACTYKSGQGLTIYINGAQKVNMPLAGNIMPGPGTSIYNQPLFIGWDGGAASRWFKGSLDEIVISPRAFTPGEIMQQYLQSKDGLSNNSTVISQETNIGEKWNCTITPNDSFRDGMPKTSNTVTVLGGGPQPPVISAPSPSDLATGVPITLSTLSFNLTDNQGKLMNYTVTTTPNIGGGSNTSVPNGTYNVIISGLTNSTTYSWVVNVTDGALSNTATYTFTTSGGLWSSWKYSKSITVDHTKVSANLANFPMLIDLTDSNLPAHAQPNGNDIVFVDSTGNKLNHEIESYNPSNGHLTAWVNIPNLSSTTDTTLSMYYGNPNATNQQNATLVWDSNFLMVQHLNETSGAQYDSTANHNDGTPTGAITEGTTGKIGGGDQFTGGHVSDPQLYTSQTQFTFSAWIMPQSGARYFISEWANYQGAFLQVFSDSQVQFYVNGIWVSKPVSLNQWHYVVATYDGTTARLWVDGGSAASVSATSLTWGSQKMYIGDNSASTRQFKGLMDEVRASRIARSNEWINTEYANQNDPSSFYTIGPEVNYPG